MDIHAPEGPTRSFKEFAIHILIVTIGILIALGLEGIRESIHEHNLIVETRATFRQELTGDRNNLTKETENVADMNAKLDSVLRDFPRLVKNPEELQARIKDFHPAFYYFRGTEWGAASSSGVLTYMKTEEASKYADVYFGIESYQTISRQAVLDWTAATSYFASRRSFTPQDAVEGEQRLRTFQIDLQTMMHADQEFMESLNTVLPRQ